MADHIFTYPNGDVEVSIPFGMVVGCSLEEDGRRHVTTMGDHPDDTGWVIPKEYAEKFMEDWSVFRERVDRGQFLTGVKIRR